MRLKTPQSPITGKPEKPAGRIVFPCGHSRGALDFVDPDFDVICPKCFGHFFGYAFLPYFIFLGMLTCVYFYRLAPLTEMLFTVLSLFVASYVSAVLRRRFGRLLLVLAILLPVSLLVATRPRYAPLKPLAAWCLLSLVAVLVVSLVRGIANAAKLKDVHKASPIVFILLAVSMASAVLSVALHLTASLAPSLNSYSYFTRILVFIDMIQRYRLIVVLSAIGVALIWSGALSISAAREEQSEEISDHSLLAELGRILRFIKLILVRLVTESVTVFWDSLRHFWTMASSALRSLALMILAWVLAACVHSLAQVTSDIWRNDSFFLPQGLTFPFLLIYASLTWLATWSLVIVAFVHDNANNVDGTWSGDLLHAWLVLRYNLLRSTLIYWFYFSMVVFVSWFLIGSIRFSYESWTRAPIGILFCSYGAIALVLALGTTLWRTFRKLRHSP